MTIMQGIVLTGYVSSLILFAIGHIISPNPPIKNNFSDIISWVIMFWVYFVMYWGFFIWLDIKFGFLKWF